MVIFIKVKFYIFFKFIIIMIKKETLRMIKDRVTESINGLMEMYI